jgi:putative tryptophan/tyrosine transport system substrate-binding protein
MIGQPKIQNRKSKNRWDIKHIVVRFLAIFVTLATCGAVATAQQPKKVARIGFLAPATQTGYQHFTDAFLQGLRALGYVEGQNIVIEYRWAEGNFERLPELAVELVRLKVDVIVAAVTQASLAAKNATGTIPIVMVAVANPVDSGLVASLAQPGANITGTSAMTDEIVGKQLELLKETFPKISRVAAMWNPTNPVFQKLQLRAVEATARELNVGLQKLEARDPVEIERAFAKIVKEDARALVLLSDPLFTTRRQQIADLALKYRVPAAAGIREYAEAGLLMSYGVSFTDLYRRAATYVDKILKGAKPASLPVERSTKFEFVINLKTAKQIGVTIPQSVLYRADKVIK